MDANYWKNGVAISGSLKFEEKSLVFTTNSIFSLKKINESFLINDIIGIELETIFSPLLRINLNDGTSRTFTVWNRESLKKKILEQKEKK